MTTRVLVVGDTHCTRVGAVPDVLLELADRADHVVHTGDVIGIDVLDALEALSPVTGVCGNVDGPEIAARLPEQALVELDGVRIGVVHDAGPRLGRHARLRESFPDAHVIAYGHSHLPELERIGDEGLLVVNPGSPTQRRRAPTHTIAWVEIDHGRVVEAELVHLDESVID